MKTVFKWIGYGVGGLVALAVVAVALVCALSAARFGGLGFWLTEDRRELLT